MTAPPTSLTATFTAAATGEVGVVAAAVVYCLIVQVKAHQDIHALIDAYRLFPPPFHCCLLQLLALSNDSSASAPLPSDASSLAPKHCHQLRLHHALDLSSKASLINCCRFQQQYCWLTRKTQMSNKRILLCAVIFSVIVGGHLPVIARIAP